MKSATNKSPKQIADEINKEIRESSEMTSDEESEFDSEHGYFDDEDE